MYIGQFCTRNVITIHKESSIQEAARMMRLHHVGSLVIISRDDDGARPLGILTDRDIVIEILAEEVALESISVQDIMTRCPLLAREHDDIFKTMEMMRAKGVRRLPITDSLGLLIGIVTTDDLLRFIYEEMGNMVSLISREQSEEFKRRSG